MSRAEQQLAFARRTRRHRLIPVAVGLGVILAVAGCGASQTSQTATQVAAVNGAAGSAQQMLVRDAQLQFPKSGDKYSAGSDAQLILTIVNGGDRPDQLVKVSSPNAASAEISGQSDIPGRFAVRAGDDTDDQTGSSQPGAGQSSSAQPSGSTSPSASAAPGGSTQVGKIRIVLKGLTQNIVPGQKIAVAFLFRNAGETTLQLPIAAPPTTQG